MRRAALLLVLMAAWAIAGVRCEGTLRLRLHKVVTARTHAHSSGSVQSAQAPVAPPGDEQLLNFRDSQYYGMMGVGTPSQWFTVLADTGSPVTWLPSATWCSSKRGCDGHRGFNASASSTCVPGDATVRVQYGDGTGITGTFVSDSISLGGLDVEGVQLAVVTAGTAPASGVFDGLLGLGLAQNVPPGVIEIALSQGLLAQPMFGVWLNKNPLQPQNGGELMLGGVDTDKLEGPLVWANVTSNTLGGWPVPLDGVYVGGVAMACDEAPCVAAIDTGTSLILGPPDAVNAIYAAINAAMRGVGGISCEQAASRMPSVAFGLAGQRLVLTPQQYLRRNAAGQLTCEASFGSVTFTGVPPGYPTWLLGDAFLGSYYAAFDLGTLRVGFARSVPAPTVSRREAWVARLLLWRLALLVVAAAVSYALVAEWERVARNQGAGGSVIEWVAGDVDRA